MIRYYRLFLTLILFCLFPFFSLYAMQDGQTTITVSVEDDYTNTPVESVLVSLLDGGSEIALATTDENSVAEIFISVISIDASTDIIQSRFR
ncbi:hypothetical protein [Rhodohalobacter sp. 8-1]|uniref:hypothetical protein n=1 Tax=Rhodohalobacter sp. 8-1 TaxID=3131972 RepID=UPI0030EF5F60